MKYFSLVLLGSFLALSGAMGCSENATTEESPPPALTDQSGSGSNQANEVPDDLGGTNLTPPPAPPAP